MDFQLGPGIASAWRIPKTTGSYRHPNHGEGMTQVASPESVKTVHNHGSGLGSFWRQRGQSRFIPLSADLLVLICLLLFGIFQYFSAQRVSDFQHDDVFYADAGRSLIQHGFYGINGHPETNQPPGLPVLLGLFCLAGSCTHLAFLRGMVFFETLGFLVTYQLLKRQVSRVVAASICLLLISSTDFFLLATQYVFPSFPYFFTSMSALLAVKKFESATTTSARIKWGTLLTLLIAASLMFASAAMAFLAAIVASTGMLFLRHRQLGFKRLRLYIAVFLFAAAVQGMWMHRKPSPLEWPLPGYPRSYLSQLKVKSGNDPELGMATLGDIPVRVLKNAADGSIMLSESILRRWIDVAWMSVLVTGPILLILVGWGASIGRRGGSIQDWYFAAFQGIYLLWPWKMETRFLLPVAPLACLYLWRGGRALFVLAKCRPRYLGVAWYPLAVILAVSSWFWMHGSWIGSHLTHAGLQDESSFVIWVISAILAVRMLWAEPSWKKALGGFYNWFSRARIFGPSPLQASQGFAVAAVLILCLMGLRKEITLARANTDFNLQEKGKEPDVLAGEWINSHAEANAIVMARQVPTIYHYSGRKIVWFPPSSNPKLLMDGIQIHKVEYILVVSRFANYYLPPDDVGMDALLAAYPKAFELVYSAPAFKVFRPLPNMEALKNDKSVSSP